MFRKMRRNRQLLSEEESLRILNGATAGVLALAGDDGYPYAVPLSYVYNNSNIYFHGAVNGHKIDAIKACSKASFCVVAQDCIIPEKYTTCYRSVIVFGTIRILNNDLEKKKAAVLLAKKYYPAGSEKEYEDEINRTWRSFCIMELKIEHITGKQAIELQNTN